MTLMSLLILLLVAGICGSIGQAIAGYSHGGCLVSIALGFIGALVGMGMAHALHLPELFVVRIGGVGGLALCEGIRAARPGPGGSPPRASPPASPPAPSPGGEQGPTRHAPAPPAPPP